MQLNKTLSSELFNTRNIAMERLGQKHPLILTQKLNQKLGSFMRKSLVNHFPILQDPWQSYPL